MTTLPPERLDALITAAYASRPAASNDGNLFLPSDGFVVERDDGTNRICSLSNNGRNWWVFHSVGRTDFLTADHVGFYVSDNGSSRATGLTLLSWRQS